MNTLEVPIEIEVYEGCTSAIPLMPARRRRASRFTRLPRASAPRRQQCNSVSAENESAEALQFAGALPAEIVIE